MKFLEVLAHEGEEVVEKIEPALDEVIRSNSIKFTIFALLAMGILTAASIFFKHKSEQIKYILFGGFVLVVLATTVYLAGSTIYLNQVSQTGGPVHWHADFEIYNCGQKIEIKDPEGFSNKVGTEVVHEHDDDRIHIEGVILDKHDASIEHFFEVLGGELRKDHMSISTADGLLKLENGQDCNGQAGMLQVFVYRTEGHSFYQKKIEDPTKYIISPHSQVPPGDCIIIEFDKPKTRSDKLCNFYQIAKEKGELIEK